MATTHEKATMRLLETKVQDLRSSVNLLEAQKSAAEKQLAKAISGNRSVLVIDNRQSTVDEFTRELKAKQHDLALATAELQGVAYAIEVRQRERNAAREAEITKRFGAPDREMRFNWSSHGMSVEIQLLVMEYGKPVEKTYERNGEKHTYNEPRFGYSATVYGPEQQYETFDPATKRPVYRLEQSRINWGSLGAQALMDAEDFATLMLEAVALGRYLNANAKAWMAEDDAE